MLDRRRPGHAGNSTRKRHHPHDCSRCPRGGSSRRSRGLVGSAALGRFENYDPLDAAGSSDGGRSAKVHRRGRQGRWHRHCCRHWRPAAHRRGQSARGGWGLRRELRRQRRDQCRRPVVRRRPATSDAHRRRAELLRAWERIRKREPARGPGVHSTERGARSGARGRGLLSANADLRRRAAA